MFVITSSVVFIPNHTIESSHPTGFEIDGKFYPVDIQGFLWSHVEDEIKGWYTLSESPLIRFKYLSQWENDCDRCGSKIKWDIPKGAKVIY